MGAEPGCVTNYTGHMAGFLLVSTRPEEEALDNEYQAYARATGLTRNELVLAEFDLVGLPPVDLERYAGVFVSGSPYGDASKSGVLPQTQQRISDELSGLFSQIIEARTPVLATGTAMTVLVDVLGGKTTDEFPELAEVVEVQLTREAMEDPVFGGLPESFLGYAGHTLSCGELPEGAVRLALSLNCPIEAFRYGEDVYATQFNPELDAEAIRRHLEAYADAGYFGVGDPDSLVSTGRHTAGNQACAAILRNFVAKFR